MPVYRIQNTLQDQSGMSKDRYVNTFYVASITPLADVEGSLLAANTAVSAFYTRLAEYWGQEVGGGGHTVKAYDMQLAPGAREPISPITYSLTPSTGGQLPTEVCVALTLESSPIAGVAPQSTRGRVFLGPLTLAGAESSGTLAESSRPSNTMMTAMRASAMTLCGALPTAGPGLWLVVASTVHAKAKLAIGSRHAYQVTHLSVDNAFDIQRSRGNAPTRRDRSELLAAQAFDLSW